MQRPYPLVIISVMITIGCWDLQSADRGSPQYWPVNLTQILHKAPELSAFPSVGSAMRLPLPAGFSDDIHLIEYSQDGKALYVQKRYAREGFTRVEFAPSREISIPGSDGFGPISSIVTVPTSGKMMLSGLFQRQGPRECGIFELDSTTGKVEKLLNEAFPDCSGSISPDGKRSLHSPGNHLKIVDLDTGASHSIGDGLSGPTWSPNGRWIAAIRGSLDATSIVLIDADDTRRRRNLGLTSDGQAKWSPDSKYLLIAKPQVRQCGPDLWSLEIIDVATGKRSEVMSAHCKISETNTGWLDPEVLRELP